MEGHDNGSPELVSRTRLRNILVSTLGMLVAIGACSILGVFVVGLVLGEWVEPGADWGTWLAMVLLAGYLAATIATALRMWWNPAGRAGLVVALLVLPVVVFVIIGLLPGPG